MKKLILSILAIAAMTSCTKSSDEEIDPNAPVGRLCPQCQQLFSSPHIHTKSTADKKSTDKFLVMEYAKLLQETFFQLLA